LESSEPGREKWQRKKDKEKVSDFIKN
jgi:hypothetical protein